MDPREFAEFQYLSSLLARFSRTNVALEKALLEITLFETEFECRFDIQIFCRTECCQDLRKIRCVLCIESFHRVSPTGPCSLHNDTCYHLQIMPFPREIPCPSPVAGRRYFVILRHTWQPKVSLFSIRRIFWLYQREIWLWGTNHKRNFRLKLHFML